ncbi:MAG: PspC domain-containing protein [Betaproteobacteria bacterium]
MNLAEQLQKLQALREQGALSEEEFTQAKKRLLQDSEPSSWTRTSNGARPSALQGFHRSLNDKWLGGVCGGLAISTDIPAWAWRILFVLTVLLHGVGLLVYLLMWIFVPSRLDVQEPARVFDSEPGPQ